MLKGVGMAVELGKGVAATVDFVNKIRTATTAAGAAAQAAGAAGSALGGGAGLAGVLSTLGPYALAAAAALAGVVIVCKQIASMRASYEDYVTNNVAAGNRAMENSKAAAEAAAKAAAKPMFTLPTLPGSQTFTVPDSMKPGKGYDPKLYTDYQAALKDLTTETAAGAAALKKAGASDADIARYQDARDAEKKALSEYHNAKAAVAERQEQVRLAKQDVAYDATGGFAADLADAMARVGTGKTELERLKMAEDELKASQATLATAERALTYARESSGMAGDMGDTSVTVTNPSTDYSADLAGLRSDVQALNKELQWIRDVETDIAKNTAVKDFIEERAGQGINGNPQAPIFQDAMRQMLGTQIGQYVRGLIG